MVDGANIALNITDVNNLCKKTSSIRTGLSLMMCLNITGLLLKVKECFLKFQASYQDC